MEIINFRLAIIKLYKDHHQILKMIIRKIELFPILKSRQIIQITKRKGNPPSILSKRWN